MDRERRHAPPLRQPEPRRHHRRRAASGAAAAGRAGARRLALLGGAAADRRFPADSPFARIAVPADVRVNRQVLADPDALRDAEVWAELRDGTPLVTAARARQGPHRALPRHRRSALVEPSALRRVRGHAERHRRHGRHGAAGRRTPSTEARRRQPPRPGGRSRCWTAMAISRRPDPARRSSPTSRTRRPSAADAARPLRSRRHGLRAEHRGRRQRASRRSSRQRSAGRDARARARAAARHADLAVAARRCRGARHPRRARRARALRPPDAPLRHAPRRWRSLRALLAPARRSARARRTRDTRRRSPPRPKTQLAYVVTGNAELDDDEPRRTRRPVACISPTARRSSRASPPRSTSPPTSSPSTR